MNVSSIVVKTDKEHLPEVIKKINTVGFCEVHFHDPDGKIIATIEGDNIHDQTERLKQIQNIPFVYSAGLSYSYCEDEVAKALGEIEGHKPALSQD
ncbi:MAG: chaperone NapD [Thermodesulfovibrionia bacterium]|nr:chaperone NapD [Thermodesulfovibrionia bacterium]